MNRRLSTSELEILQIMIPSRICNRKTSIALEDHRKFNLCLEA